MSYIVVSIVVGTLFIVMGIVVFYLWSHYSPMQILKYVATGSKNGSIYVVKNGSVILDAHSDTLLPLASTVKIIIAIEFARQAAAGQILATEAVKLSELDKFYIKNTDGGAHESWLKDVRNKKHINNLTIPMSQIARGMIKYSSNANAEYLMSRLGFDNVNNVIRDLELSLHEPLYPFVSCLLVLRDHSLQELRKMTKEEYIRLSYDVHHKLKAGVINKEMPKRDLKKDNEKVNLFSELFIKGTTKEYGAILSKLNSREYFSVKEYEYIDPLMATPFSSTNIAHDGEKGGSTKSILTMAFYETTLDGNKTEFALFLDNLTPFQKSMFLFSMFKLKHDFVSGNQLDKYQNLLNQIIR